MKDAVLRGKILDCLKHLRKSSKRNAGIRRLIVEAESFDVEYNSVADMIAACAEYGISLDRTHISSRYNSDVGYDVPSLVFLKPQTDKEYFDFLCDMIQPETDIDEYNEYVRLKLKYEGK